MIRGGLEIYVSLHRGCRFPADYVITSDFRVDENGCMVHEASCLPMALSRR
jgi:hypothetical protein